MIPEVGDILIAPHNMVDPRFKNSVILLTHHEADGSFGLCVNKPTEHTVKEMLENNDIRVSSDLNFPMYWGGPVGLNKIWMIHSPEWSSDHTVEINHQWSMTSNESMFHIIADGQVPKYFRVMFGFSAWGPDQLENELTGEPPWRKEHSWLIANAPSVEWLLDQEETDLWKSAVSLSATQAVDQWL